MAKNSYTKMDLKLIYTFSVLIFVKTTVLGSNNEFVKYIPVSTTELPSTPSIEERISEKLHKLEQQLQITNNKNKQELITIKKQNENILKNAESNNNNKNEIDRLHEKLDKLFQNINNKLDKMEENMAQINQQKYITKTCDTKLDHIEKQITEIKTIISIKLPFNDCYEIQLSGNYSSGVYKIQPKSSSKPFLAWCNMDTNGGGWTYVLNRFDGSQNFELNWNAYKFGFGTVSKEFWMGLENLYLLTSSKRTRLLVELSDWEENTVYAHYDNFEIGSEKEEYKLKSLGTYTGTAGDCLEYHLGMKFSTYDKDQDEAPWNCAKSFHSGWWHNACHQTQLTGLYLKEQDLEEKSGHIQAIGIHWVDFRGYNYSLKSVKMMIKPL